jgi:hypothetical protein
MSSIQRRGKRSWRFRFEAGADPITGKRVTKVHTLKGTRRQAEQQAAKIIAAHASGMYVDQDRQTVKDFAEHWLATWAVGNVSNKTLERYEALLKVHVVPRIGAIPIQRLRAGDLQSLYAGLKVADRTRLHIHRVIHRMLRHAAQWNVVHQNVATLVDAPSVKSTEIEILTPAEIFEEIQLTSARTVAAIGSVISTSSRPQSYTLMTMGRCALRTGAIDTLSFAMPVLRKSRCAWIPSR